MFKLLISYQLYNEAHSDILAYFAAIFGFYEIFKTLTAKTKILAIFNNNDEEVVQLVPLGYFPFVQLVLFELVEGLVVEGLVVEELVVEELVVEGLVVIGVELTTVLLFGEVNVQILFRDPIEASEMVISFSQAAQTDTLIG